MTPEELAAIRAATRGVLDETWGDARSADDGTKLPSAWDVVKQAGWSTMLQHGALDGLLAVATELGRAGCPLPAVDIAVATWLTGSDDPGRRTLVSIGSVEPMALDGVPGATHVLVVADEGASLRTIAETTVMPGLAAPAWSRVTPGDEVATIDVSAEGRDRAAAILRLGLAARATGAARRSHELAVEFSRTREQFGRPIGSYQAVQHRAVDAAMALATADGLFREAVRLHDLDDPAFLLAAELAVEHARVSSRDVQFAAHHTLAANGYFEEHEAPWLFRRVHADVLQLQTIPSPIGTVADALLDGHALPRFDLGATAEAFRAEVRSLLEQHDIDESSGVMDVDIDLTTAAAEAGWFGVGWPVAHGGRGASLEELAVLSEELGWARAPLMAPMAAADILGGAIVRHGTADQQERFLPPIRTGDLTFYLGYSEPEIGSDLAGLHTSARRDGDDWIVNGTKMWGTMADRADWVWLAARTDPEAPKHAGLTVFLFETGLPGWSKEEHRALSGEVSCTTRFEDVRIPDSARVGEVDGGWPVIVDALLSERQTMAGHVARTHRRFDELLDLLRSTPDLGGPPRSAVRATVTALATRLQGARVLVHDSIVPPPGATGVEASMAKIVASELAEELGVAALDILGPAAALADPADGAIHAGGFSDDLRLSIMHVVGGGTNDIQRNLVARALGVGN